VQPNHYVVRDANKQQLAYVYYENEPGRRSAAKLRTKDEARRIAANVAKLLVAAILGCALLVLAFVVPAAATRPWDQQ